MPTEPALSEVYKLYGRRLYNFCAYLLQSGVKEITLLELSDKFIEKYPFAAYHTRIGDLYRASDTAGIKVTDCAWSR